MTCCPYFRRRARAAILLTLAFGSLVRAQEIASGVAQDPAKKNAPAPCLQPPPLLSWQDYQGPFQKVVGAFARKLDLKSVHAPQYKSAQYKLGTVLCSLEVKDKFTLFVRDTFEPISFLEAAFNAGLDQASNRDPTYRQGTDLKTVSGFWFV